MPEISRKEAVPMTDQTCVINTKEYPASGGVLIIENIAEGTRKKTDIIRGIIEHMACSLDKGLVQSACRNTADCGSQKKEAGY
jgi:hypothetical protein